MEINTHSLIVGLLLACSLPLLLAMLIIVPVLWIVSWLQRKAQYKQSVFEKYLLENKSSLAIRVIGVLGFLLATSMFVGILFFVYWFGKQVGIGKWAYLYAIVIPLLCSIPFGVILLLYNYRRIQREK